MLPREISGLLLSEDRQENERYEYSRWPPGPLWPLTLWSSPTITKEQRILCWPTVRPSSGICPSTESFLWNGRASVSTLPSSTCSFRLLDRNKTSRTGPYQRVHAYDQLTPSGPRSRTTSGWTCSRCQPGHSRHVLNTEDTDTKVRQAPAAQAQNQLDLLKGSSCSKGLFPPTGSKILCCCNNCHYPGTAALSPSSPCRARTWNLPLPPHLNWNDCDWRHCLASACTPVPVTTWPPAAVSAECGVAAKDKTKTATSKASKRSSSHQSISVTMATLQPYMQNNSRLLVLTII